MNSNTEQQQVLLKIKQVLELVPVGKTTLYKMIDDGKFPRPIRLSERAVAWRKSDILQWIDNLETTKKEQYHARSK